MTAARGKYDTSDEGIGKFVRRGYNQRVCGGGAMIAWLELDVVGAKYQGHQQLMCKSGRGVCLYAVGDL